MNNWVISCNSEHYNISEAFKKLNTLHWKQSTNIQVGDIVYIYVTKPLGAIKYKTKVNAVDLPSVTIDDQEFVIDGTNFENRNRYMELELLQTYDDDFFTYNVLKNNGLRTVQRQTQMTDELLFFILQTIHTTKITDEFRKEENQLDQNLIEEVDSVLSQEKEFNYTPKPKNKPSLNWIKGKQAYSRNPRTAGSALIRANHQCEINPNHPSFIRRSTNQNYSEPHHLIPLAFQDFFDHSLDVEANIVSLCSNCHNEIHYGKHFDNIVHKLYELRKDELEKAGIPISYSSLRKLYG